MNFRSGSTAVLLSAGRSAASRGSSTYGAMQCASPGPWRLPRCRARCRRLRPPIGGCARISCFDHAAAFICRMSARAGANLRVGGPVVSERLWVEPQPPARPLEARMGSVGARAPWTRRSLAHQLRSAVGLARRRCRARCNTSRNLAAHRPRRISPRTAAGGGGGLSTTLVSAGLIGLVMDLPGALLAWPSRSGRAHRPDIVTVLVREVAPVLVGLVVLGRSGVVIVSEIGELQIGGQVRTIAAQGLDPFLLLVLPRACALAIACFTLGVMFVVAALLSGFVAGSLLGPCIFRSGRSSIACCSPCVRGILPCFPQR